MTVPTDLGEGLHTLQRHDDPLNPIGDLDRYRIEGLPSGLLEIGELRDLLAVEPNLPSEAPCAERRRLPVVFDEAQIVTRGVDPQRKERTEVAFLWITGIRFEDHLELVVVLPAVRILAKPTIGRAKGRLDIGDIPRLRAENAQEGRRIHRARAHFSMVRLPDQTALVGPELLQSQDRGLEGRRVHSLGAPKMSHAGSGA